MQESGNKMKRNNWRSKLSKICIVAALLITLLATLVWPDEIPQNELGFEIVESDGLKQLVIHIDGKKLPAQPIAGTPGSFVVTDDKTTYQGKLVTIPAQGVGTEQKKAIIETVKRGESIWKYDTTANEFRKEGSPPAQTRALLIKHEQEFESTGQNRQDMEARIAAARAAGSTARVVNKDEIEVIEEKKDEDGKVTGTITRSRIYNSNGIPTEIAREGKKVISINANDVSELNILGFKKDDKNNLRYSTREGADWELIDGGILKRNDQTIRMIGSHRVYTNPAENIVRINGKEYEGKLQGNKIVNGERVVWKIGDEYLESADGKTRFYSQFILNDGTKDANGRPTTRTNVEARIDKGRTEYYTDDNRLIQITEPGRETYINFGVRAVCPDNPDIEYSESNCPGASPLILPGDGTKITVRIGDKLYDEKQINEIEKKGDAATQEEKNALAGYDKGLSRFQKEYFDINLNAAAQTARRANSLTSLLFGKDAFSGWRESVNNFFSQGIGAIISGKWDQALCLAKVIKNPKAQGILLDKFGTGSAAAHIEGEKSLITAPLDCTDDKNCTKLQGVCKEGICKSPYGETLETDTYLYKFTFAANIGSKQGASMTFNVRARGEEANDLFENDFFLDKKQPSVSMVGQSAYVLYSPFNYHEVCLIFKERENTGIDRSELCNDIIDSTGREIS